MKYFLLFFSLIIELCDVYPQNSNRIRLVDSETKNGIAFAYIKYEKQNIIRNSDEDGYFQILPGVRDSIAITHVAYKPKKILVKGSGDQSVIELYELPIELNPTIVNANTAKNAVSKAIINSSNAISVPKVLKTYREDVILFRDTIVADAKAEILMIIEKLNQPSKGSRSECYLRNINALRNKDFKHRVLPSYSLVPTFVPINLFLAGYSKNDDKLIYFSFHEVNDSIVIITFNPSQVNKPEKNTFVKNGRFIINSKTGMFLRIDSYVSPETLRRYRSISSSGKDPKEYIYEYSLSQFFDLNGMPTEVQWRYSFSYGRDDPGELWQHKTRMVLVNRNTDSLKPEANQNLKPDSALVQLRSHYSPEFERSFGTYFPLEELLTE